MDSMPASALLSFRLGGAFRPRLPLAHRSTARELLDDPDVDPASLAANLRDLVRLNRLPGGATASIAAIDALAESRRDLSVVDVGTGAGDIPRAFVRHARRVGSRWKVIAVDSRSDVVAYATSLTARYDDVGVQLAHASRLPFEDGAVDIAHASLLMHHLEPADAVSALRAMSRVARVGVVINDLRRGPLAFALGAPVVMAFGRSAMTRHDGILSLRRAYTLRELDGLLAEAELEVVWRSNRLMPRVVTAAVPRSGR